MSTQTNGAAQHMTLTPVSMDAIERVIVAGDLAKLTSEQRVVYYRSLCEHVGISPLAKPFDYLVLNGKTVLYANRNATDQLRQVHRISLSIARRETIDGVHIVTAQATTPDGRVDESTGAVNIKGLSGDALANAYMKAETKAKRRVTLSITGLSMLDETEVETVPAARPVAATPPPVAVESKPDATRDVTSTAVPVTEEDAARFSGLEQPRPEVAALVAKWQAVAKSADCDTLASETNTARKAAKPAWTADEVKAVKTAAEDARKRTT